MSDTQESVRPSHKHRRGLGKSMVAALGFGRLSQQLAASQESTQPADNEYVSGDYQSENTFEEAEREPVSENRPAEQTPEMKEPETVNGTTNTGLSYIEAIQAAKDGWHVCRTGWSEGIYVFVEDGARIMKCTEKDHLPNQAIIGKFTPLVNDVLSNDWEILLMPNKTFQEALAAMIKGHFVRRSDWQYLLQIKGGKFCSPDNSQQEYALRYEDMITSDWEIHAG